MYQSKMSGGGTFSYCSGTPVSEADTDEWLHIDGIHLVGVEQIDEQHRQLAALVNGINEAIRGKADDREIGRRFEELVAFIKVHFNTERDLMERYRYPGRKGHLREHGRLLADVPNFKARISGGGDLFVLQSIKDWWLKHIAAEDKRLGEFILQTRTEQSDSCEIGA